MRVVELICNNCKNHFIDRAKQYKYINDYVCPLCNSNNITIRKIDFEED